MSTPSTPDAPYTPTTADVQVNFSVGLFGENRVEGQRIFHEWLAAHDAEVKAAALEELIAYSEFGFLSKHDLRDVQEVINNRAATYRTEPSND